MRCAVATAAALALFTASAASAASSCVTAKDEAALQTRLIQTELMVAALTCKKNPQYNEFVTRHQKELMKTHTALRAFFKKRGGEEELNSFITRLANDSSKRSIANVKAFCANSATMYDGALSADVSGFTSFAVAQPVSRLHGFVPCTPTQSAKADLSSAEPTSSKRVPVPVRKPATLASLSPTDADAKEPEPPVLISR